jgi:hypothetical protein
MPQFVEAAGAAFLMGILAFVGSSIMTLTTQVGAVGKATKNTYGLCALVGFFFYGVVKHSGG